MVSNCRSSEGNALSGDQSGNEYRLQSWWSYPWDVVLRHPSTEVQHLISDYARHAAENDNVGYSMGNRLAFDNALQRTKDNDPANITYACDADCSSSTAAIVRAVGRALNLNTLKNVSASDTTWTLESDLLRAGFETYKTADYTQREDKLEPGDILLNTNAHVCIYVADSDYDGSTQTTKQTTQTESTTNAPALRSMSTRMPLLQPRYASYVYPEVKNLQYILKGQGFSVDINGKYDIATQKAILDIQKENNLVQDYECGSETWLAILSR